MFHYYKQSNHFLVVQQLFENGSGKKRAKRNGNNSKIEEEVKENLKIEKVKGKIVTLDRICLCFILS